LLVFPNADIFPCIQYVFLNAAVRGAIKKYIRI